MESGKSRWVMRILAASVFISLFGLGVMAQDDPDPNSPTPVLLGLGDSTRALAVADNGDGARVNISRVSARAFDPDSKVTLYGKRKIAMGYANFGCVGLYISFRSRCNGTG